MIENISPSSSPPIEANQVNFFRLFKEILPCKGHFHKIKNQNLKTIGYLFGTLHQCDASIFKLNDKINSAISKSKKAFLEFKNHEKALKKRQNKIYNLLEEKDSLLLKDAVVRYEKRINKHEKMKWAEIKSNNSFETLSSFQQIKLCCEYQRIIYAQKLGKTGEEAGIEGLDSHL